MGLAELETRAKQRLGQCLEIQGNSSDWRHSEKVAGLLMKKNSFLQKLNIWHVLCYPLMFMIKCQVEKKMTKMLKSMRQL